MNIYNKLEEAKNLSDIRKLAKEIKIDQDLAIELFENKDVKAKLLALLIMDHKKLTKEGVDEILYKINTYPYDDKIKLCDWFLANQLTKNKTLISYILDFQDSDLGLKRRIFYYYKSRLYWMGKYKGDDTLDLLNKIESDIENEVEEVQWAMNFLVAWIGIFNEDLRQRCIDLGLKTGLYKDDKVSRGCTPNYLPDFIKIEVEKRNTRAKS